jgi:hypothetical protein
LERRVSRGSTVGHRVSTSSTTGRRKGSANRFEANLGVGPFVIGGVSGTLYLSGLIEAKKKSSL